MSNPSTEPRPFAAVALTADPWRLPMGVVLAVMAAAGAAALPVDVAQALLGPLVELPGVRAGAVVHRSAGGGDVEVIGSVGYPCDSMGVGVRLPLAATLPVTECVRRGRTIVQGHGPGWVAVPLGLGGALLLSLTVAPPEGSELRQLELLGRHVGSALERALAAERLVTRVALLEGALQPSSAERDSMAVRRLPWEGSLSGDVAEVADTAAGTWLLVADVKGRGASAAVPAAALRAAFRAVVLSASSPAAVLTALDRVLDASDEDFATALVVLLGDGEAVMAAAGHPVPLVVHGRAVHEPAVTPGAPLGLGMGAVPCDGRVPLPPGALLVVWTDGVVDRGEDVDLGVLLSRLPTELAAGSVADQLLAACERVGPQQDDATLVVVQV